MSKVRGRYAPSPTGDIHLGNARTALVAWLSARSQGGSFVWRVEDLDGPRVVPGMEERQLEDLAWLGLDWDAGPYSNHGVPAREHCEDQSGDHYEDLKPFHQSQRGQLYADSLRVLDSHDLVFPCSLTRRDLRSIARAPHRNETSSPYPASLRPETAEDGWLDVLLATSAPNASIRLMVEPRSTSFTDGIFGSMSENVAETTGDFILRRRDGLWAYQLAVVVDDAQQGITEIVRGADLLSSTARQILLQEGLGLPTPRYLHVPLLVDENGQKLSKRNDALTLRTLRSAGWAPEDAVGYLAHTLGLKKTPGGATAKSLVAGFDPGAIPLQEVVVPHNLETRQRID